MQHLAVRGSGKSLQGHGVKPDERLSIEEASGDTAVQKGMEILRSLISKREAA